MPSSSPAPTPETDLHTPAARRAIDVLPGAALLAFVAVGFVGMVITTAFRTSPDLPMYDGQWGVAWEDAVDDEVFFHDLGVNAWGIAEYAIFRNGRAGVLVGDDGWLFTSEEFALYPSAAGGRGDAAEVARKGRIVATVADAMQERGVRLLVAVVPAKARIEAAHLGRYRVPAEVAARPAAFLADLHGRGIETVDLTATLGALPTGADAFLHTDTHWTPEGAAAAAHTIATTIRAGTPPAWLDSAHVSTTQGAAAPHDGDLLRFVPLGPLKATLGPPLDTLHTPTVTVESSGGLLDDVTVPVALVGTSYSDDVRWAFAGALQRELGADVLNAAAEGRGPFLTMMKYLDDDAWKTAPPQLVIWEIPERYLAVPDDLSAFAFWQAHQAAIETP
jgi:alginate O-acetyltransferase complex protein AlgJ